MRAKAFDVGAFSLALLLAAAFSVVPAAADTSLNVQGAYYIPNHGGYGESGFALPDYSDPLFGGVGERSIGSTWGGAEAKAVLSFSKSLPFLRGEGPLFSGNSLRPRLSLELSPVSFNLVAEATVTPIAILAFDAGAAAGTGWSALSFTGLAINPEGSANDLEDRSLNGLVWRVWGAGTFQFDIAAIAPGAWNHVVTLATAKFEYKAYTGAQDGEAWLWESDKGENFNGAKFYGTYVLAYQMPLVLDTVGVMLESEEWLGDVRELAPMVVGWGSDYRTWQIGALGNVALGERDSLATLIQFKRLQDWTDGTTMLRDFRDRVYDGAYWYFNRIAFSYTHKF